MSNGLINKELIMEAWVFLRKHNMSIPNETLDFMREASLEKLQNKSSNSEYKQCEPELYNMFSSDKDKKF